MIRMSKASKVLLDAVAGHEIVLKDAFAAIPTDSSVAILGPSDDALTATMLLLTGADRPDRGEVRRPRIRMSPLINSRGLAGASLIPSLTVVANLRLLADANGADAGKLVELVDLACDLGPNLIQSLNKLDWKTRRALEVAAIAALPFDCYFVDRMHSIETRLIWMLLHSVSARGAGLVFSTRRHQQAENLADTIVTMEHGEVRMRENARRIGGLA